MEASITRTNSGVKLTIKLKHIGLLVTQLADWLFAKERLQEHGLKGIPQQCPVGNIIRLSKSK